MAMFAAQWGTPQWVGVVLAAVVLMTLIVAVSAQKPEPAEPEGGAAGDESEAGGEPADEAEAEEAAPRDEG